MLEFEKKVLLTVQEYYYLLKYVFTNGTIVEQTNYYYDNDDFDWNRIGITCRIRKKGDRYKATIKEHKNGELDCSTETSCSVLNERDEILFEAMNVKPQGSLYTVRTTIVPMEGIICSLDKNSYLRKVDYELEIEYAAGLQREAEDELKRLSEGMSRFFSEAYGQPLEERVGRGQSKAERFFARKAEIARKRKNIGNHSVLSN